MKKRMIRTYLDSGVLITVARAEDGAALGEAVLVDPGRRHVTSRFVELETLPHAMRSRQTGQARLYRDYFARARVLKDSRRAVLLAMEILTERPMQAMDALHVAAAELLGADEIITTERPGRAIYWNGRVRVKHVSEVGRG